MVTYMSKITGLGHVAAQADDEKICVDLTGNNSKAAELDFRMNNYVTLFLFGFQWYQDYYQLLFAVLLHGLCETISSCKWQWSRFRKIVLTPLLVLFVTTINKTNAAEYLFENRKFKYSLHSFFSHEPLENILGKSESALVATSILI